MSRRNRSSYLAMLLALAMLLTCLIGTVAFAQEDQNIPEDVISPLGEDVTYAQVTEMPEGGFGSGSYVFVAQYDEKNYAVKGEVNGKAMASAEVTIADGKLADPAAELIWTYDAEAKTLTASAGTQLYYGTSGTAVSLREAGSQWNIVPQSDGLFAVAVAADGVNRSLLYQQASVGFKAYANSNAGVSGYSGYLMVFRKEGGEPVTPPEGGGPVTPPEQTVVGAVSASPAAGEVEAGTAVTLTCATEGATIYYRLAADGEWILYSGPITVSEAVTIEAFGAREGMVNGPASAFAYTIKEPLAISSLKSVYSMAAGDPVKVSGQVAYKFGGNSILLQEVTGGEIVGLQVYDYSNFDAYVPGATVTVEGTVDVYGKVTQIKPSGAPTVTAGGTAPAAQEVTISELGESYLSEYVVLRGVTLGIYSTSNTPINDADGRSINIYKAPAFPEGIAEGSTVDLYAACSRYNDTWQLRVGASSDYVDPSDTTVTIAQARALALKETATVKGIVTFIDGRNIYIQDATGGIDLYLNSGTVPAALAVGDQVRATGARAEYKGLVELSGIDGGNEEAFRILSSGNALPAPKDLTVAELLSDTAGAYESTRVRISGAVIGAVNTSGNTALTQDGSSINIYKIPALTDISEGDTVTVTGVVGDFNGYQLRVAAASDVVKAAVIADPIPTLPEGVTSLKDARDTVAANTAVTTVGQLVYRFGNYDSLNSAILYDVIDGEQVWLQVYNSLDDIEIGEVVQITGTKSVYGGVPQVQSLTSTANLGMGLAAPAPVEFESFADLKAAGDAYLSAYVRIKNVTLGEYNSNGSTPLTDSLGGTMNIYRAATYPSGTAAGDKVDVLAANSRYNSTLQLRVGSSRDYVILNDVRAPEVTLPAFLDAEVGRDYIVSADITDNVGVVSAELQYACGGASGTLAMTQNPGTGKYTATIPGSAITAGNSRIAIVVAAKDAAGNEGRENGAILVADKPQVLTVTPVANSATGSEKRPVISVVFINGGEAPAVTLTLGEGEPVTLTAKDDGTGVYTAFHTPEADLPDGRYTAEIRIVRTDGAETVHTWVFTVGELTMKAYFGQLHSHTAEYSDGSGTLIQALEYAKNQARSIDFVAITDHSNYFDTSSNLGDLDDASKGTSSKVDPTKSMWQVYKETIQSYTDENFVALYGYEMTWSGGPGHMNTFNSEGVVSRNDPTLNASREDAPYPKMQNYYNLLKEHPNTISQFNHPGSTFGTFGDFAHWDPAIDALINMVEVGNGEGAVRSSSYWPSYEYYTLALDKGWHVAPTNNQDNHKGKWGDANTARSVIWTDDFSEAGLLRAMRQRNLYATEDENFEIYYSLNDRIMGSIIDEKPETVHLYASFNDPDAADVIGKVSVIVNGGVTAYSETINSSTGVLDVTLPAEYSYYYIRVDQGDQDIAVTAPVWTGDVTKVGIGSVEKDVVMEVVEEPITITTNLYNYESAPLTLDKVTYSFGGEVLAEQSAAGQVPAMSELALTHTFIPKKAGPQTFTVRVEATLNGVPMVFTYNLDLNPIDGADLVHIAIDGGHNNFYVTGNYADSDANFIAIAAENGVRVSRLIKPITYDAIKDMALVVLTVPFKSYGTSVADSLYSASELEALAQYAAAGGNLVVCSKSDRGDPAGAGEQASVISNAILEAVGSDTRVGQGIVIDEVRKANELYRITLGGDTEADQKCFNYGAMAENDLAAALLRDVREETNNTFSAYNSAPILPGTNAIALVSGFPETTWATHYSDLSSNDTLGADPTVVTEKGQTHLMTAERLPGGGLLVTSGVTFFSTFEVKIEVENATTKQNTNYQLAVNLLRAIKPQKAISDISAAQNDPSEGVPYTVEGTVTSNASGYDRDTAFFDCIYVQDATGGINCFPVDGVFRAGQKVRVTGRTSSYQGERQLAVTSIELIDEAANEVQPEDVPTGEADSKKNLGRLLKLRGVVRSLGNSSDGALETIVLDDGTGEARVFIDGYITKNIDLSHIQVGDTVSAVGLGSIDTLGPRLRVRNRAEIQVLSSGGENTTEVPPQVIIPEGETIVEDEIPGADVDEATGETEVKEEPETEEIFEEIAETGEEEAVPATGDAAADWAVALLMAAGLAAVALLSLRRRAR